MQYDSIGTECSLPTDTKKTPLFVVKNATIIGIYELLSIGKVQQNSFSVLKILLVTSV